MLQSFFLFIPLLLTKAEIPINISTYDEAKHVTFLEQNLDKAKQTVLSYQNKKISESVAIQHLGILLGKCRNIQSLLTNAIQNPSRIHSKRFIKLLQAQSIFETYLTTEVLALDGDKESEFFGRSLQLRLMKLLPSFHTSPAKL